MAGQAFISPTQFQRRLGMSRWAFHTWRKNGIIPKPAIQKGRITRWTRTAVEQFATQGVSA